MTTGYEGHTLSELERIAYNDRNFLAQEILDRCAGTVEAEFLGEQRTKQRTKWKEERKD